MIFDILQVLFSGFICYCLYLVVIIPEQEKKQAKINALSNFYEEEMKRRKEEDKHKINVDVLND